MNLVILTGNVTRDPETGTTQNGITYTRFGIAVQKSFKDADGERGVDFFNCVAWRGPAEFCAKYLKKGIKVTVSGRLNTTVYSKDGSKRQSVEIVADDVEISFARTAENESKSDTHVPELHPIDDDDLPF